MWEGEHTHVRRSANVVGIVSTSTTGFTLQGGGTDSRIQIFSRDPRIRVPRKSRRENRKILY